jgi:hypothetical protein
MGYDESDLITLQRRKTYAIEGVQRDILTQSIPCYATAGTQQQNANAQAAYYQAAYLPYSRLGTMTGPYFMGAL